MWVREQLVATVQRKTIVGTSTSYSSENADRLSIYDYRAQFRTESDLFGLEAPIGQSRLLMPDRGSSAMSGSALARCYPFASSAFLAEGGGYLSRTRYDDEASQADLSQARNQTSFAIISTLHGMLKSSPYNA